MADWALLGPLSDDERREVLRLARRRRFSRHEVVFHEGDPGDTLHLIDRGHVAARVTTPLGDVATLVVLGPGQHFGELALVAGSNRRNSTVIALDAVETLSLHRDEWEVLRARHSGIDRFLVAALAGELTRSSQRLLEALYLPVDKRVLRRILELAAIFGGDAGATGGSDSVVVPLTQEDIAGLAGTSRPSANRVLRAAEEAGLVRVSRGRVEILDVEGLRRKAR